MAEDPEEEDLRDDGGEDVAKADLDIEEVSAVRGLTSQCRR